MVRLMGNKFYDEITEISVSKICKITSISGMQTEMSPVEFGAGTVMLTVPGDWYFWKQDSLQPSAPPPLVLSSASVLFSIILFCLPWSFVLSNIPMAYIRYREAEQQGPGINSTPRHKRMELIVSILLIMKLQYRSNFPQFIQPDETTFVTALLHGHFTTHCSSSLRIPHCRLLSHS